MSLLNNPDPLGGGYGPDPLQKGPTRGQRYWKHEPIEALTRLSEAVPSQNRPASQDPYINVRQVAEGYQPWLEAAGLQTPQFDPQWQPYLDKARLDLEDELDRLSRTSPYDQPGLESRFTDPAIGRAMEMRAAGQYRQAESTGAQGALEGVEQFQQLRARDAMRGEQSRQAVLGQLNEVSIDAVRNELRTAAGQLKAFDAGLKGLIDFTNLTNAERAAVEEASLRWAQLDERERMNIVMAFTELARLEQDADEQEQDRILRKHNADLEFMASMSRLNRTGKDLASAVLGIGGAVIGGFYGGPAGASMGYSIGSMLPNLFG